MRDPVVAACLRSLVQGDLSAAFALADRLEELGDARAEEVRAACTSWQGVVCHDLFHYGERTLSFCLAMDHRILRGTVCALFAKDMGYHAEMAAYAYGFHSETLLDMNQALVEELCGAASSRPSSR